ncbi:FAD/NAD(P)-binding domain-containing protein [Suhomyces tanzawaensis NRRL Y-17324]|uniref:FAD/NAD(P)-binding domain-containing protein n=1 Tax=Suhomyces tanzawaensis NRRL Y-17324 TaxID=984487 RepID=A0A1E4SMA3_9ASCO|nr:FAD/NAD(P)-binding domain-containing protein [Suhomyces tanzawaensis NRRL Y-17324]ODV80641.1 FAD/NAD(P)-binding domain-containing protein [Suhomyces tanzawaensis NRRL Y-17324]
MPLSIASVLPDSTTRTATSFTTNVLVVGGAYAGLAAVKSLKKHFLERSSDPLYSTALASKSPKISITLVEPRSGFLNIIGIPKAFVDTEFANTQYVPLDQLHQLTFDRIVSNDGPTADSLAKVHAASPSSNKDAGIELTYVHGRVTELGTNSATYALNQSQETATIAFDYVILASGRNRSWPTTPEAYTSQFYLDEMRAFKEKVASHHTVSIIGAGAVGIEVAGDIKLQFPEKTVNLIHPHASFPPEPLCDEFKKTVHESLQRAGVNILTNTRIARELPNGDLETTSGEVVPSSLNQWCNSHRNNTQILTSELRTEFVTASNNILVNDYLQLTSTNSQHTHFFVIGDLVELPIIKSAGWAMYMGRQAANNITSLILDDKLVEPMPDLTQMPRGMVLVAGNGEIVSELSGSVELNHEGYVNEYKDYCIGKVRVTLDL